MLGLGDLKQTRAYQEAKQEGQQEGEEKIFKVAGNSGSK
jgi:predicted transposase YdaD